MIRNVGRLSDFLVEVQRHILQGNSTFTGSSSIAFVQQDMSPRTSVEVVDSDTLPTPHTGFQPFFLVSVKKGMIQSLVGPDDGSRSALEGHRRSRSAMQA